MQISLRLVASGDRVLSRNWAKAKATDLRKDEPHPVTSLHPGFEFRNYVIEDRSLSTDETFEVVNVSGHGGCVFEDFTIFSDYFVARKHLSYAIAAEFI